MGFKVLDATNARFMRCMRRIAAGLSCDFFLAEVFFFEVARACVACVFFFDVDDVELVCEGAEMHSDSSKAKSSTNRILTT